MLLNKDFDIKNLNIHIENLEDTNRWMKQHCDSHIASGVYSEDKDFLSNLTEMLQCGFGIYLGFNDEDVTESFTREEISNMTPDEYRVNENSIMKQVREGRI